MTRNPSSDNTRGIIFELIQQGSYVKVSAIDAATGTEVSIVGDPSAGQNTLKREAGKKLQRILLQKKAKSISGQTKITRSDPPSGWDL